LLRDKIFWVLGVCGFPPTKANAILYFDSSRFVCILMVGILGLLKDILIILFGILVSDKF